MERKPETVATPDGIDPVIIERIEVFTGRGRVVKTLRPDIDSPLTNGVSVKWSEITRVAPEPDFSVRSTTPAATGASVSMVAGNSWLDIATREDLVNHIIATRSALRQLSEELECNVWSDELHLADVVEKHIGRSAAVQAWRSNDHTCPTCGRQTDDITDECWDCMEKHSE